MAERLLICTDLDRTLIPNGPQSESAGAREHFAILVSRPEVTLTYVTGRHRELVEKAIANYRLPIPDFVVGDVGTTIYNVGPEQGWLRQTGWEVKIARDWSGKTHADLKSLLQDLKDLRIQEDTRQNDYKLSYYVPLCHDYNSLSTVIQVRLQEAGVNARLIWSVDEPAGIGLLDVLPSRASKYHALEELMKLNDFSYDDLVFCGDSGNDIEVLASPIPAVLVANSQPKIQQQATSLAVEMGYADQLYVAQGGFNDMNGNYCAGMLEGITHYHPQTLDWMMLTREESTK